MTSTIGRNILRKVVRPILVRLLERIDKETPPVKRTLTEHVDPLPVDPESLEPITRASEWRPGVPEKISHAWMAQTEQAKRK